MNTGRRAGGFWRQGEPFVWATGAALALTLLLTFALLAVVLWNGLGVFWLHAVAEVELADGKKLLGEELQTEINADTGVESIKFKVGNMEDGPAFRWIDAKTIRSTIYPKDAFVLERLTNMNYYGYLRELVLPSTFGRGAGGEGVNDTNCVPALTLTLSGHQPKVGRERGQNISIHSLAAAIAATQNAFAKEVAPIQAKQAALAGELKNHVKYEILRINYQRKQILTADHSNDSEEAKRLALQLTELQAKEERLKKESDRLTTEIEKREADVRANAAIFADASGREKNIALLDIVRFYCPNQMGIGGKLAHYGAKVWELLTADPRESNQDGGLFPA
ncbi:MAG: hypothetical protein ABSB95_16645, partial [Dissulfurispiraceae bacterium]